VVSVLGLVVSAGEPLVRVWGSKFEVQGSRFKVQSYGSDGTECGFKVGDFFLRRNFSAGSKLLKYGEFGFWIELAVR
jgi:hypothetical protein